MAPKKKKQQQQKEVVETEAERLARITKDNELLTETLNNLKQRSAYLRRENAIVQEEVDQTRLDTQEYRSYMMLCAQRRQTAMDDLNNETQQKLDELSRQREEMVKKHKEQLNFLKKKTLEKENEMAPLQRERSELGDLATARRKQLDYIKELEQKVADARTHHLQAFQNLTERSDKKLKQAKTEVQRKMLEQFATTTKKTVVSHKLSEENRYLNTVLHQLTRRARALREHKENLEIQRLQLLTEKELYSNPEVPPKRSGESKESS